MKHTPLAGLDKLYISFPKSGKDSIPDLDAALRAFKALVEEDFDEVLRLNKENQGYWYENYPTPSELLGRVGVEFYELLPVLKDNSGDGFLFHLNNLPEAKVWTFFTTYGQGDDLAGDVLSVLQGMLIFDDVRQAIGGEVSSS